MRCLVATDGSDVSLAALDRARELLRADAHFVLVTVIPEREDPLETAGGFEGPLITEEEADAEFEENKTHGEEALARTRSHVGADTEVRLITAHERLGDAIVEAAEETDADVIVMGARVKGVIRRLLTASVSDYVIHHAPCPVLVVREDHLGG